MNIALTSLYAASALGCGNDETYANYKLGIAPGMKEISGDIPSRKIWFGSVTCDLPAIEETHENIRTNALLRLAVESEKSFKNLVSKHGAKRVGVVLGASNTGVDEAEAFIEEWLKMPEASPPEKFDFSFLELGTPALYLKKILAAAGPAYTISTACSSATKAFGAAKRLIENGICDAVVTGGVDGRCRFAMNGFHALGALSEGRCRPLAPDRDGINLGEAVALFVMERADDGIAVRGIGECSDAYHATAPDPTGAGAERAMREAMKDAGLSAEEIDYVNLHGTGTVANDEMEMAAVNRIFVKRRPFVESTKNLTGHCLGAAGAIEAAICMLLLQRGDYKTAVSNSFAFGGSDASIVLST